MDEIAAAERAAERPGTDEVREPTWTTVSNPRRVRV